MSYLYNLWIIKLLNYVLAFLRDNVWMLDRRAREEAHVWNVEMASWGWADRGRLSRGWDVYALITTTALHLPHVILSSNWRKKTPLFILRVQNWFLKIDQAKHQFTFIVCFFFFLDPLCPLPFFSFPLSLYWCKNLGG